jgi:hypothetical protein
VTDPGAGPVQFSLMSGLLVGDTVHTGARNLEPASVIGFHPPSRKAVSRTTLDAGPNPSVQAPGVNPTGRYLCAGVLVKAADDKPNLLRWDLTTPDKPALGVSRTGDHDIRALAVAPDGTVFPVGGIPGTAPAPREYDPATGAVTNRGDPQVRMKSHAGHPPKITIGAPLQHRCVYVRERFASPCSKNVTVVWTV